MIQCNFFPLGNVHDAAQWSHVYSFMYIACDAHETSLANPRGTWGSAMHTHSCPILFISDFE